MRNLPQPLITAVPINPVAKEDTAMICQLTWRIKALPDDFWKNSLTEVYLGCSNAVRTRRTRFHMPGSEYSLNADRYELCGGYFRKEIIDIQQVPNEDGTWRFEEVRLEAFRIQRIKDKQTGKTHAILPEFFVPYKQYSLRCILYHLREFFMQPITQEAYCLESGIEVETFRDWLKWLKSHATVLAGLGFTEDYRDNWKIMREWIQKICKDISGWARRSLRNLNLALFQQRPMPKNTMYQNAQWSG